MSNSDSKPNKVGLSAGISAHENLIHEHRKFLEDRLKSAPVGSPARDALIAEKNVWDSFQVKEQAHRLAAESDADAKEKERKTRFSVEMAGVFLTIVLTLVTIIVTLAGTDMDNAERNLKRLALAASIFGLASSFCFVWGHRGSVAVDGVAKFLAFSAAILAVGAAGLLMKFGF